MSTTGVTLPAKVPLVRPANAADEQRVFELVGRLGHAFPVEHGPFQEAFQKAIADGPRTIIHVAEVDGTVVGYALTTINYLLYSNGPSAQLQEIVVAEESKTRGVGTALVRAVEEACVNEGVTQLTVASRRAGGFYDRLGYTQQAEYMRRLF